MLCMLTGSARLICSPVVRSCIQAIRQLQNRDLVLRMASFSVWIGPASVEPCQPLLELWGRRNFLLNDAD